MKILFIIRISKLEYFKYIHDNLLKVNFKKIQLKRYTISYLLLRGIIP